MSETLDVMEETLDRIEETLDILEKGPRDQKILMGALIVVSLSAGAMTGYYFAKRKYRAIADKEVAEVKEHYAILHKEGEYADLNGLASRYEDILEGQQYLPYNEVETVVEQTTVVDITEVVTDDPEILAEQQLELERAAEERHEQVKNVFDSVDPDTYFDYEEELKRREEKPTEPYVITLDEFTQGERDFEQSTVTYYDGDDVLADERDAVVEDVEGTVGHENLLRFGHGSKDKNVVYVRNERLGIDYEVLHSDNHYAQEVLGFLEHSDKPIGVRKFRNYDY